MASTWAIDFFLVALGLAALLHAFGAAARGRFAELARPMKEPPLKPREERIAGSERLKAGTIV